jgi:hypothetical protein
LGKSYVLNELSDEIILVLRNAEEEGASLNIGFPFPVYQRDLTVPGIISEGYSIDVFLRGERIRSAQRAMLVGKILKGKRSGWEEIEEVEEFRKRVSAAFGSKRRIVYVDPYTFIGDSIIGLHFLDSFIEEFGKQKTVVLSRAYKHLSAFFESYEDDSSKFSALPGKIMIMPDLVDSHWGKRIDLLQAISRREGAYVFLVARNLLLKLGASPKIWHYSAPDPLLRDSNIESYMDGCLSPFMPHSPKIGALTVRSHLPRRIRLLLNPISSITCKNISPYEGLQIFSKLSDRLSAQFYLVTGREGDPRAKQWTDGFLDLVDDAGFQSSPNILRDNSLADLVVQSRKLGISAVISADTAVSHLFGRVGTPITVIYRENFWDSESMQSLSSDSPIGFCRFNQPMFPFVLGKDCDINRISELLADAIQSLLASPTPHPDCLGKLRDSVNCFVQSVGRGGEVRVLESHSGLLREFYTAKKECGKENAWLFDSFNPERLLAGVLGNFPEERTRQLVCDTWRVSTAYKYSRLFLE